MYVCMYCPSDVNPKRHLYRAGRSWSITVESSNRASHQLVSHVMKILLTEVIIISKQTKWYLYLNRRIIYIYITNN